MYLQPHNQAVVSFSGTKRSGDRPWALVLWAPSQRGCFLLCPQVHHEYRFPPTSSTLKGFLEGMTGSGGSVESWTLEAAVIQGCLKVRLIHLWSNLVTNAFMFPVTAAQVARRSINRDVILQATKSQLGPSSYKRHEIKQMDLRVSPSVPQTSLLRRPMQVLSPPAGRRRMYNKQIIHSLISDYKKAKHAVSYQLA